MTSPQRPLGPTQLQELYMKHIAVFSVIEYIALYLLVVFLTLMMQGWKLSTFILDGLWMWAVAVFAAGVFVSCILFVTRNLHNDEGRRARRQTVKGIWIFTFCFTTSLSCFYPPSEYVKFRAGILAEEGVNTVDSRGGYIVSKEWLATNLYRVSTYQYREEEDDYIVFLLQIEPAVVESFDELKSRFLSTPYSDICGYTLQDGVNCQGMTSYIVDWCQKTSHAYKISYTPGHTYITVQVDDSWYKMSFTTHPICEEVEV